MLPSISCAPGSPRSASGRHRRTAVAWSPPSYAAIASSYGPALDAPATANARKTAPRNFRAALPMCGALNHRVATVWRKQKGPRHKSTAAGISRAYGSAINCTTVFGVDRDRRGVPRTRASASRSPRSMTQDAGRADDARVPMTPKQPVLLASLPERGWVQLVTAQPTTELLLRDIWTLGRRYRLAEEGES
jgi:hypothetical protein